MAENLFWLIVIPLGVLTMCFAALGCLKIVVWFYERNTPTTVCAWCGKVMNVGSPMISHGLCIPCRDRYFAEYVKEETERPA